MLPRPSSRKLPGRWIGVGFPLLAAMLACAQDISVVRLPNSSDMTVRLESLSSHQTYERSGNSYFIVPAGRYSIQLLRNGSIAYQEVEYISASSPETRTVNPERLELVVGLPDKAPQFDPTVCSALLAATKLTLTTFGLHASDIQRRLASAQQAEGRCGSSSDLDAVLSALAGPYGATKFGSLNLSIEFTQLAPQRRPANRGNSNIYNDPTTQRLAASQQPAANLTPALVTDIKNGITAVGVDGNGQPLLLCGAINANSPVFCDSNGFVVATPAIANLHALYRFSVGGALVDSRGVPEDHWTTFVSEEEYRATQQKLEADLATVRLNLQHGIEHVQAGSVLVPNAQEPHRSERHYASSDLLTLIQSTEDDIDLALRNPTLRALRPDFPQQFAKFPLHNYPSVNGLTAESVFRQLRDSVATLFQVGDHLDVELVFRTTPAQSGGTRLTFDNCDRCKPIVSDGGEHRFYRGKYHVKAERDGFAPYEGWLDLVDDPRTIFECEMVPTRNASNSHTSTCSLKTQ